MTTTPAPKLQTCWNDIGIAGDRSCPELFTHIHCRNCPVYSTEGRRLLERNIPDGYTQEWTTLLETAAVQKIASPANGASQDNALPMVSSIAVVIFRVHSEWLALPAHLFKEITPFSQIHTIPHRSNEILLGLVNIRGELQMCASLAHLLSLKTGQSATSTGSTVNLRMMVLERKGDSPNLRELSVQENFRRERWVFPVDEIYGVQQFQLSELKPAPTNVSKSTNTYTKGLIGWRNTHVSFLDDELLFYTLTRRVL